VQATGSQNMYLAKRTEYFGTPRMDIAPLLPGEPGQPLGRVLEIGCGSGATMAWLRTQRPVTLAVGVELTEGNAAVARAAFDEVIAGSIEAPAVVDSLPTFDLILALDVLEHLVDPAAVVRRLATRLAPGGAFVVSLPHVGHYSVALPLVLKGRWTYQDEGLLDRTHLRFFDRVSAPALLTENGLTIERLEPVIDTGGLFNVVLFRSSRRLRWYTTRLLQHVLPGNMLEYRFLIRGRVPG